MDGFAARAREISRRVLLRKSAGRHVVRRHPQMSDNIRPLDVDALVEKYVRLSPAVRYCQFICLAFGLIPLLLLFVIGIGIGMKLIDVALGLIHQSLALDFDLTQYIVTGFTDRHQFGWLVPRTLI